jgi:hypothetical protein
MTIKVTFIDRGRKATRPADPKYPRGFDLDLAAGFPPFQACCRVDLPYPARSVGLYALSCGDCGFHAIVTAAGRADDPRSVRLPCKSRIAL